ncbi:TetR/AcrR family transcriptional regulator [Miniphocaeibacter massiliensis]|uniref:TetR/AcrR family transcriptional regulator n=1 Tax=Miniphocaeibacter massiliensis TaxID=2041841 RepID=UPI000C1B9617|nr:TetR/AcrR family transcriptional regulator [Miniphocaeibacter massiliensis]
MTKERNPEKTKQKILDVAKKMFLEKGYDNTSIQDIVDGLGGMTRGSIYHHFKSKFDILDTILERSSQENLSLLEEGDTGLETLRKAFLMSLRAHETQSLTNYAVVTLKSPRMIGEQFLNIFDVVSYLKPYMKKAIEDGSIKSEYLEEIIEILLMYMNLRIGLYLPEISKEDFMRKMKFIKVMLEKLDAPIFNDEVIKEAEELYDYLHREK